MSSAKQYVEDKQYEFETSVSLLMNVKEGSAGADILSGGNAVLRKSSERLGFS